MRIILFLFLFLFPMHVFAAFSNPSGVAGDQMYNSTHSVIQYCDGTDWTAMGGGGGSGRYFACSN